MTRLPILAALGAALLAPAASAEVVSKADMPRYCQGMASAEFDVNPRYITMEDRVRERGHGFVARGAWDYGDGNSGAFRCRFNAKGEFKSVRERSTDEEDAVESSAARAGRGDFDATGPSMPCAQAAGQPMGQCPWGVARDGNGSATVVVTRPDGRTRALFFENGEFLSADTSQADGYPDYGAEKSADLFRVFVGEERYEIPDAVIFGG